MWVNVKYKELHCYNLPWGESFGNQGQSLDEEWRETESMLKSSVKFPQSVMIWAAMSSAGVGPLCFLKSTVNAAIYQEILEHFMLLLTSFMEMLISFSSRTWHLPTLTKVPKKHGVTVLDCHRESMGYCQEEDERQQTQQCRWPEGLYQSNLGFITPEQCHKLITSMPRRIDAVIHAKGGPTKYWVHRNEHTFQKPDISV